MEIIKHPGDKALNVTHFINSSVICFISFIENKIYHFNFLGWVSVFTLLSLEEILDVMNLKVHLKNKLINEICTFFSSI